MPQFQHKRKKKLVLPGLQMKLIGAFLAVAGISVLLQSVFLIYALASLAREAPHDMLIIMDGIPRISAIFLLLGAVTTTALTFATGVVVTHRIAGPIYRFEQYLKQVIRGERPPDCRLRKKDQLMGLCALINEATAPLRTPLEPAAKQETANVEPPAALPSQAHKAAPEAAKSQANRNAV